MHWTIMLFKDRFIWAEPSTRTLRSVALLLAFSLWLGVGGVSTAQGVGGPTTKRKQRCNAVTNTTFISGAVYEYVDCSDPSYFYPAAAQEAVMEAESANVECRPCEDGQVNSEGGTDCTMSTGYAGGDPEYSGAVAGPGDCLTYSFGVTDISVSIKCVCL